ncbi:hypothetical protein M408DRAFT_306341 [Serendipita vermifera MAFF 305830]|uniref:Uncharacterized protein n=1 Tax=Serendipita vermifera MAFF 305830 TaxID=933852 RepID=A0A0C3ANG3_SERVB|nr:hypothetical protein M408DRAFT_306341 [Serendipita vermifera MAFF 305830]
MFEARPFDTQTREWKQSHDGIEIAFNRPQDASPPQSDDVELEVPITSTSQGSPGINAETHGDNSGLVSTTDDIARICPRLCVTTPAFGRHVFDTNAERLLKLKKDGGLGEEYWAALASSANFLGKSLAKCLDEIHLDMVAIWNFKDPSGNLRSKEFKALMWNMVTDVLPGALLTHHINSGAFRMRKTLMLFMAYTVDFTLVMWHIFVLVGSEDLVISRRMIKLAYTAYNNSDLKTKAHLMINYHAKDTNPITRGARDTTVDKIDEIINLFRMDLADLSHLQVHSGEFQVPEQNEPW